MTEIVTDQEKGKDCYHLAKVKHYDRGNTINENGRRRIVLEDLPQFSGSALWLADVGPRRDDLGQWKYNFLKNVCITGFKGARGQVEFLLHVVESAPTLQVVTINTTPASYDEIRLCEDIQPTLEKAKRIAVTSLSGVLKQNVKLDVI